MVSQTQADCGLQLPQRLGDLIVTGNLPDGVDLAECEMFEDGAHGVPTLPCADQVVNFAGNEIVQGSGKACSLKFVANPADTLQPGQTCALNFVGCEESPKVERGLRGGGPNPLRRLLP
jgi:hypothetical protein